MHWLEPDEIDIKRVAMRLIDHLDDKGLRSLREELGCQVDKAKVLRYRRDWYGVWGIRIPDAQDRVSLQVWLEHGKYFRVAEKEYEGSEDEVLVEISVHVPPPRRKRSSFVFEPAAAAWQHLLTDAPFAIVDYPHLEVPAAPRVALLRDHGGEIGAAGVWLAAQSRVIRPQAGATPEDLFRARGDELAGLVGHFARAVHVVLGAIAGQPVTESEDTVLGWCGEYALWGRDRGGQRFSESWYSPWDITAGNTKVEVKTSGDASASRVTLSPSETALALRERENYRLVRVVVDGQTAREVHKIASKVPADADTTPRSGADAPALRRLEEALSKPPGALESIYLDLRPLLASIAASAGVTHDARDPLGFVGPHAGETMIELQTGMSLTLPDRWVTRGSL